MRILPLLLLAFLTTFASCAGSGFQKVPMPPQTIPISPGDVCRVYVLRSSDVRGSLNDIRVLDGDYDIGTIESDEYLCWERQPGRTLLKFYYAGMGAGGKTTEGLVDLEGQAGHVYVYSVTVSYPDRKPEADLLSEADARAILKDRKPAPVK
jgi:hypothetical protein